MSVPLIDFYKRNFLLVIPAPIKVIFHSAKNPDQTNFSDRKFHFPFGAQIIFSFEIFSCFSKSFPAKKIISTLLIQQQILLLNLMKRKKYQIKNKRIKRYWMREIFQERKGKSLFTKLVKVLQLFNIKEVK